MRSRAFGKTGAALDPAAVTRLALFWGTLTPETQGYFEQLYQRHPQDVSTVLAGVVLPKDGTHPNLASWVATAQNQQGTVDTSRMATLTLTDVTVAPATPMPTAAFAVTWSVTADNGFQERKDRLQILKDGTQVADKTIDQKVIGPGASVVRHDFGGGLPPGSYVAYVVANVEGGDTVPNRRGLQASGTASFVVGQAADAQRVQDTPKFSEAVGLVQSAAQMNAGRDLPGSDPPVRAVEEGVLTLLAEAADDLASMGVMTDPLRRGLGKAGEWLRQDPPRVITEKDWATLRGQLIGLPPNIDEAGKYAEGFLKALEELRLVINPASSTTFLQ
jgi:hypothetical protein